MRTFAPLPERIGHRQRCRALFERYVISHSAHTPKPEIMFKNLVKSGMARIVRRRGKPPLLEFNRYI